ncbi:XRE family transcriptional regulator [Cohnella lubricantis]|uniref:XRE family transcriptional regulator n=1 Tax=Cohnella lubricantis TaxID=2163172 RepID=A0A841TAY7_9BACL|nr:XRE family transcriptional regulator [Cohnella lubricantis]MBB6678162.1 XRE family transcriptional regulator [Cohnella lubricantis]MBP2119712.1 transcriptional regulator with XRE-family HTH domain [Cohnella lubricantis]
MLGHQEKHRIEQLALRNRDKIGKGIRKPRFRKPKSWTVRNRVLMAVLIVEDVKLSELAEELGVAPRTVASWIYEGVHPTEEYRAAIAHKFGLPQHVLFHLDEHGLEAAEAIAAAFQGEGKFYKRALLGAKRNRILSGLFAVHGVSPAAFSRKAGIAPATTRKYMHQGALPDAGYRELYCDFFGLPEDVLFYEARER